MPGVKIGNGAVIGAGSVVTKDVPDYAILVGAPAKILRYRFSEDTIKRLVASEWWGLDTNKLKDNIGIWQKGLNPETLKRLEDVCKF